MKYKVAFPEHFRPIEDLIAVACKDDEAPHWHFIATISCTGMDLPWPVNLMTEMEIGDATFPVSVPLTIRSMN